MNFSPTQLTTTLAVIVALNLCGLGYLAYRLRSLEHLRRAFFTGPAGDNLEALVTHLGNEVQSLHKRHAELTEDHDRLERHVAFTVQKVGLIRFNPFGDGGGSFSFALALLNAHDTGIILTSMHGRDQHRTYTKRVMAGQSDITLTEEEIQAVEAAKSNHLKVQI